MATAGDSQDLKQLATDLILLRYPYAKEVGLFSFALLGAIRVKQNHPLDISWAQSLVLTFFVCFGGGIIAPFLLGRPPVIISNDLIVVAVLVSWFLVNRLYNVLPKFTQMHVIRQIVVAIAETFRVNAICSMVITATNDIPAGDYYPIPFWGPIVLGTLIGCGGMFLPFDKGLKSIEKGSPWPLQSAFYAAFMFHVTAHDPNFRKKAAEVVGSYTEDAARVFVVLKIVVVAVLQTFFGDDFNPFRPIHKFVYVITGIKKGRDVEEAPKEPKKKKDE